MKKKTISIDLISYFLKFLFLVVGTILLITFIINSIEFLTFIFDKLETKLCIYKSILNKNNIVSEFLITHKYDVYGAKAYIFLDESTSILGITLFLRLFECFKCLLFTIISYLIFYVLHKYSRNEINKKYLDKYVFTVAILFILVPFIYLLRDYIGCLIINKLPIKNPHIYYESFKIFYLFIGITILSIYLTNKVKYIKILKIIFNSMFILIFIYFFISSFGNFINVLKIENKELLYHKLLENKNDFISILANNSFNIFGYSYTYLGYYTDLKSPIMWHYLLNSLIYIILVIILSLRLLKVIKNDTNNTINYHIVFIGIYLIMMIFNIIVNISIIDMYNNTDHYNINLEYRLINIEYLYYIIPTIFIYILSLKEKRQ